jgi:hypothetical protein
MKPLAHGGAVTSERLVDAANREGAVPDRRCHALRGAAPHVADGEDVRPGGLEEPGLAVLASGMVASGREKSR